MLLKIGSHLIAHNTANNQTYNTEIINKTKTYYICKKLRTLIDHKELLYYTDEQLNIDRNFIKSFIDTNKDAITLNYKKRFFRNKLYDDIYNVDFIKVSIRQ